VRWEVTHESGAASRFHERALETVGGERRLAFFAVDRPALVLGSTQRDGVVDHAAAREDGIEVVRRRSGGGAVLLVPGEHLWVDVAIGRDDPQWTDDVSASTVWFGEAWADALAPLVGRPLLVHTGAMVRDEVSDLVCFAGLAPGEVTAAGAKVVGISQRRTRAGARWQGVVLRRWDPAAHARLLPGVSPAAMAAVPVRTVAAAPEAIAAAIEQRLRAA
jgi:lipoate---protein ligase